MYLEHFKLNEHPFSLTPNTRFYCNLNTHQNTLTAVLSDIDQNASLIKITGKSGTGKTLLCQLLLNQLDEEFITIYIPTPSNGLLTLLAYELDLTSYTDLSQHQILEKMQQRLIELKEEGKQSFLIIDEAHILPDECLEILQYLTNMGKSNHPLLQVILVGQPSLNKKLNKLVFKQLNKLVHRSYHLKPFSTNELHVYFTHRLNIAGCLDNNLFSDSAKKYLFRASAGLPRILNILSHKALLISFSQGVHKVGKKSIKRAIADTDSPHIFRHFNRANIILTLTTMACLTLIFVVYRKLGIF